MAFRIDGRFLPGISTYADCDKHFKRWLVGLTPRRTNGTWGTEVLPLVGWKDSSKRIELNGASLESYYGLVYHRTTVVGYYPDGRVFFNAAYDSASTHIFFERLAPAGWHIQRAKGRRFYVRRSYGSEEWHVIPGSGYLWLNCDGSVKNPSPFTYNKTLANMPVRKEVRAKLKPFVEWYHAMTRVGGSMRAVMWDDETIKAQVGGASPLRLLHEAATQHLLDPDCSQDGWRDAATWASVYNRGTYAWLAGIANDDPGQAKATLDTIFNTLWRQCNGFRTEEVTVPAGEKP